MFSSTRGPQPYMRDHGPIGPSHEIRRLADVVAGQATAQCHSSRFHVFPDMVSHSLLAIRQGPERPIGIVTLDVSFSASQSHHHPSCWQKPLCHGSNGIGYRPPFYLRIHDASPEDAAVNPACLVQQWVPAYIPVTDRLPLALCSPPCLFLWPCSVSRSPGPFIAWNMAGS